MGQDNVSQFINSGAPVVGCRSTLSNADVQAAYPYLETLHPSIIHGTTLPVIRQLGDLHLIGSQAVDDMVTKGADVGASMDALNAKLIELMISN